MMFKLLVSLKTLLLIVLLSLTLSTYAAAYFWNNIAELAAHPIADVKTFVHAIDQPRSNSLPTFSWSSCGGESDSLVLNKLDVKPDPIHIPGTAKVDFSGLVRETASGPIKAVLTIEKKELIWLTIPCVDNVGSCTYNDICPMLPSICDQIPALRKYGIPCTCPIRPGNYQMPLTDVKIPDEGIPSFLENGKYKARMELSRSGKQIACYALHFSLTT
ncbi:PREDICTED: ganglioside GM2 activator-like [Priapulus caudatus]|uniref:Ganglioside GM2 activator-like n=1 Tax=Priapulus caudatus TaxID=37621 RepID=A0ABM1DSR8_PRICU|nr:PREDICTED: ganglioside GM2 activator-like [Priapulus caudatus]